MRRPRLSADSVEEATERGNDGVRAVRCTEDDPTDGGGPPPPAATAAARHSFAYNGVDLRTEYEPPLYDAGGAGGTGGTGGAGGAGGAGGFDPSTTWEYNDDRQLEKTTRPDTKILDYEYDDLLTGNGTGRLESIVNPDGNRDYDYSSTTGQLEKITTPEVELTFAYDGHLRTSQSWDVLSADLGSVEHVYDSYFEVSEEKVNGASPMLPLTSA